MTVNMVAIFLSTVLAVLSAFHLYWVLGGYWPGHDDVSLSRKVYGVRGATKIPPKGVTVLVALLLFVAGLIPLMSAELIRIAGFEQLTSLGLIVLCVLFALRSVVGLTWIQRSGIHEELFKTLDLRLYSPLCLLIALGMLYLYLSIENRPS